MPGGIVSQPGKSGGPAAPAALHHALDQPVFLIAHFADQGAQRFALYAERLETA